MRYRKIFAHPVRSFLRQQLRITTPYDVDETKDAIPITLDGLEKWDVGDRLVRDVLSGGDPQSAMLAEQLRGLLPPEDLGSAMLTEIVQRVRPLVEAAVPLRTGPARTLDVDIDLGGATYSIGVLNLTESGTGNADGNFVNGTLRVNAINYTSGGREIDFDTAGVRNFGGDFTATGAGAATTDGFDIAYAYPDASFVNRWRRAGETLSWMIVAKTAKAENAFARYDLKRATCPKP